MIRGRRYFYGIPVSSPPVLAPTTMQSSVSQYGITLTFDQAYPVGQYYTGDYFVVGPVTINSVSPAWTGPQNGCMVNPSSGGNQGWDSTTLVNNFTSALRQSFPATIQPGSSVCPAISHASGTRPQISDMMVLTVVSSAPYADSFRPPLIGTDKTTWRWSNVNTALLPNLATTASTPADLSTYIDGMTRPWPLHCNNWQGRHFHATNNMPSDYYQWIGLFLAEASTLLMMNHSQRDELLAKYIQVGIDYYAMGSQGEGTSAYWTMPVILTGVLLGDTDISDLYIDGRDQHTIVGQGPRYYPLYDISTEQLSTVVSGIVPAGKTWTGKDVGWRQSEISSNCYEQEHLHPDEWDSVSSSEGCTQDISTRETYRRIGSQFFVGLCCAMVAMGMEAKQPKVDLYKAYVKRWMEEDLHNTGHDPYGDGTTTIAAADFYGTSRSDFVDEFYAAHVESLL